MDELFERITGAASTRHEGRTYGGRTLVYHDSSRDIDIVLGADLVAATRPLRLLSRAARWYCWRLGEEARDTLRDVYRRAVAKHGPPVDLPTIWFASLRALYRSIEASMQADRPGVHEKVGRDHPRSRRHARGVLPLRRSAAAGGRSFRGARAGLGRGPVLLPRRDGVSHRPQCPAQRRLHARAGRGAYGDQHDAQQLLRDPASRPGRPAFLRGRGLSRAPLASWCCRRRARPG